MPRIGEGYAIQAVYDGSSNFKSSKSQTEYFDVNYRLNHKPLHLLKTVACWWGIFAC